MAQVDALALGLLGAGVRTGDRVGIWAPNVAEWVFVQYATAKIGAILVNINPAYRTHELEYVLNQAGVAVLVAARSFKTSDYAAMIDEVRPRCAGLRQVVLLGSAEWDALASASGDRDELARVQASLSPDDPINIQYTSGTTGFPKGATLSHHNIVNNGFFVGSLCGYTEADRVCIPVPFYHCFGMVMGNLGCTTHGATMVIPAPAFDPAATLRAVAQERCTSLYGVPTMFIAELGAPDFDSYDLSSLRTGIMAGSPCPVEVMKQVVDRMGMTEVTICYGMTETSPVSTQTRADDTLDRRVSTVGRVHPHVEVKVVDPATRRTLPRGEPGELCTRGYSVMLGYWDEPEKTAEAIDAARWMHTGDLAVMDTDGYVNITGRIKDIVVRGGENISPREVEEFLYTHPDVRDVQVVGVPDLRVRGGAVRVGDPARRRCRPDAGRRARVRGRPAGVVQDPAVRAGGRRVPDDGHRQGAQGRDAGAVGGAAGSRGGGGGAHGVTAGCQRVAEKLLRGRPTSQYRGVRASRCHAPGARSSCGRCPARDGRSRNG